MGAHLFFLGTRPEIIKAAPVIKELEKRGEDVEIVNVGQHYDLELNAVFFEEFDLPRPVADLGVGSGSQSYQTAETMIRAEEILGEMLPDIALGVGDTNSVLGSALAAVKMGIPFAHVEAGLRSFDFTMPEEINRRLVDHVSAVDFAPTERAAANLLDEGISPRRILLTGNTVVDAIRAMLPRARERTDRILSKVGIGKREISMVLTVHRRENLGSAERMREIVLAVRSLSEVKIVWPMHPHTKRRLETMGLLRPLREYDHLRIIKPLGYLDFLALLLGVKVVATDSGGIQEEAATLGIPCVILRDNTERPEMLEIGAGTLTGAARDRIVGAVRRVLYGRTRGRLRVDKNPFGDGRAGERIADFLANVDLKSLAPTSPRFEEGAPAYSIVPVGGRVSGLTVREVEERWGLRVISIQEGARSKIPEEGESLRRGTLIRVLGEPSRIESLRRASGVR